jgi:hypothetical protein
VYAVEGVGRPRAVIAIGKSAADPGRGTTRGQTVAPLRAKLEPTPEVLHNGEALWAAPPEPAFDDVELVAALAETE